MIISCFYGIIVFRQCQFRGPGSKSLACRYWNWGLYISHILIFVEKVVLGQSLLRLFRVSPASNVYNSLFKHWRNNLTIDQLIAHLHTGRPPTEYDDTTCCRIQFDLLMMRKTVLEICRGIQKIYYKKRICVLTWSVTKIILKCTVSKTSKFVEVGLAAVLP